MQTQDRGEVLAALNRWTEAYPDREPVIYWDDEDDIEIVWQQPNTRGRIAILIDKMSGQATFFYTNSAKPGEPEFSS